MGVCQILLVDDYCAEQRPSPAVLRFDKVAHMLVGGVAYPRPFDVAFIRKLLMVELLNP